MLIYDRCMIVVWFGGIGDNSLHVETFKNYHQHYVISRHVGCLLGDVWGREVGGGEEGERERGRVGEEGWGGREGWGEGGWGGREGWSEGERCDGGREGGSECLTRPCGSTRRGEESALQPSTRACGEAGSPSICPRREALPRPSTHVDGVAGGPWPTSRRSDGTGVAESTLPAVVAKRPPCLAGAKMNLLHSSVGGGGVPPHWLHNANRRINIVKFAIILGAWDYFETRPILLTGLGTAHFLFKSSIKLLFPWFLSTSSRFVAFHRFRYRIICNHLDI